MSIKLKGSTDGSVTLQAPADTSPTGTDKTFTLPTQDGGAGQILKTDGSGALSFTDNLASGRNLIINGDMRVAQRGTSFTGITGGNFKFITDRFNLYASFGTFSGAQSSTAPSGFSNSIKVDCTATDTPAAGEETFLQNVIEAQDLQQLRYGESSAKSITLSFYVRSNKTGSYGLWFFAQDGNRQYVTTYTISSADTWEYKTITVPGDASGTINDDAGGGMHIRWYLGAGTNYSGTPAETWQAVGDNRTTTLNLADSTSNEWYITGVQLEVGNTATSFEHRSFGDELTRCQRYYEHSNNHDDPNWKTLSWNYADGVLVMANSGGYSDFHPTFKVVKRANPDVTIYSATGVAGNAAWEQPGVTNETNYTGNQAVSAITTRRCLVRGTPGTNRYLFCNWEANAEL